MKIHKGFAILATLAAAATLTMTVFQPAHASKHATPTNISFWSGLTGPYQKNLETIVNDYNKSQKTYHVTTTSQGDYAQMNQKVMAAAKSHSLPVIGMTTYTNLPDYKSHGFIDNLDPMYSSMSKKARNDIYPAFLTGSKIGKSYYSTPLSKSTRIMYVNQDILKKYNLTVPKTWEDLKKDGAKLKQDGIYAYGFDKSFDMEWDGMTHAAGVTPVTSAGTVNVNNKKAISAAKFVLDMVKDGTAKSAGSDMYWTKNFVNGKSAFYIGSSAGLTQTKLQAPKDLHWTTAPVPSYDGKSGTEVAGNDVVLFKRASKKQQQGAYDFMKYLLKPTTATKWAKLTGYVPLDKSATKSTDYQDFLKAHPENKAAVNSLPQAFSQPTFVGFSEYYNDKQNAFNDMLTKGTSAKDALDQLATQTKQITEKQ
ncbi:ABC transporter substrate-binding protein [Furfurilactobacillus sp. WILCCON 0119]